MKRWMLMVMLLACASGVRAAAVVTLREDGAGYTLSNGFVSARVSKRSGDLVSLSSAGVELLGWGSGHASGYWSHTPAGPKAEHAVTIDPASNGGKRGEVAIRAVSGGAPLGRGPGGSAVVDVEIRYTMGRDDRGIYTYSIFTHRGDYPATSIGEARFCAKLNANVFDWMSIDAKRNRLMPRPADWDQGTQLNMKEARRLNTGVYKGKVEHKYDYSAIAFDTPAYGWSSTDKHVGLWFINPSIEYLSGGATKVELTGHLDNNRGGLPTLLNYWRGSHYGGSQCEIAQGEAWTKVVGPFLIYVNSGKTPQVMWEDALGQAKQESDAWPYEWVSGVDYPHRQERGRVTGRIVLQDVASGSTMSNILVGLATADVDWQSDAKHYQFWARADERGRFVIGNVRRGQYALHAIADGVLGEFARARVSVEAGKSVDLGMMAWKPERLGRQVWEIGIPDRSAAEFRHGDHYWQWGLYDQYPKDFPDDVNFIIGKSDYRTDWNYCQCPRADRPRGTPWTITFGLAEALRGRATLRLALAATSARQITLQVNGQPAGETGPLPDTATIRRDGIRGYWREKRMPFDASLLKKGENRLTLTIPPGNPTAGVEYDYLRLEVAD